MLLPREQLWGWFGEFLRDYEALVASRRINRIFIQAEAQPKRKKILPPGESS